MRVGATKTAEDGKIGGSGRAPSMEMNGDAVLGNVDETLCTVFKL